MHAAPLTPPDRMTNAAARQGAMVAVIFTLVAIRLATVRPLWLDEILQLLLTTQTTASAMLREIPTSLGASPLGYLIQQASLKLTGYSILTARLPEILFAGASVFTVALLAEQLGQKRPWIAATLFALFPLTLRYADESRLYAPALFFSVLSTSFYVRTSIQPNKVAALVYTVILIAAVYTQPYSAIIGLAHVVWSLTNNDRRAAFRGAIALSIAIITYLPWFLWSKSIWTAVIRQQQVIFTFSPKTLVMIVREAIGASYWGSGLILLLCWLAIRHHSIGRSPKILLSLLIAVPMIVGLAADAWLGYFVAIRQFIWILPALALFAAAGVESKRPSALLLAALLVPVCVWQSYKYFTSRAEDWQGVAAVAKQNTGEDGCFLGVPADHLKYYAFFEPSLKTKNCGAQTRRVVLAFSPYTTEREGAAALNELASRGYSIEKRGKVGSFSIVTLSIAAMVRP